MRNLILTSLVFINVSCATTPIDPGTSYVPITEVDSALAPLVDSFIYEANLRGHHVDMSRVTVTFGNIRKNRCDNTIGYCMTNPRFGAIVKINTSTWPELNPYEQEMLVYHEMAHCLIGRDHCSKKLKDKPLSLMYPLILDTSIYKDNREEYVDELFNIDPECIGDDGHVDESDGDICIP